MRPQCRSFQAYSASEEFSWRLAVIENGRLWQAPRNFLSYEKRALARERSQIRQILENNWKWNSSLVNWLLDAENPLGFWKPKHIKKAKKGRRETCRTWWGSVLLRLLSYFVNKLKISYVSRIFLLAEYFLVMVLAAAAVWLENWDHLCLRNSRIPQSSINNIRSLK